MIDMQATEGEHSDLELDPLGTLVANEARGAAE